MKTGLKVAILLNRSSSKFSTFAKKVLNTGYLLASGQSGQTGEFVLPDYDSFAKILDPSPLVLGTGDRWDAEEIRHCDLLIWEWGWTETPARTVLAIRQRLPIPMLMFPGQLDRFWRELDYRTYAVHMQAVAITGAIGVMLDDTRGFYQAIAPAARVFHMPVPLAVDHFSAMAEPPASRRRTKLLLTAPTRFTGSSGQMHIATYLVFRDLLRRMPQLEGLCFVYTPEERAECEIVLRDMGLSKHVEIRPYLRPISRYIGTINECYAGLCVGQGLMQGRTAMMTACLGIPMIVGDDIETHRRLYPRTCVKWYDTTLAAQLCLQLLDDGDFHAAVAAEARAQVVYYDIPRCRLRIMEGIAPLMAPSAGPPALPDPSLRLP